MAYYPLTVYYELPRCFLFNKETLPFLKIFMDPYFQFFGQAAKNLETPVSNLDLW